jgi:NADPH:quinone reductase-like Zn-dependent oxidoreductase
MSRLVKTLATSPFVSQNLRAFISMANPEDLIVLQELADAGQITPVIDKAYPLSETPAAMAQVGEGHAQGKTVINVVAE